MGRVGWWCVAAGGVALGAGALAVAVRGVPSWMSDKDNPARPVWEAAGWVAGIASLLVAVVAVVIAVRQGRGDPGNALAQTASGGGVIINGGVSGSGSGTTVGVNFGTPPDPPPPARG